ncbi:MAG: DUF2062 domain-containing protein [Candidatus Omnitrophota bacterium]|nr:DUF2062 domain-containing protein [Candidatus Omnitrophota bacterium]
MLSFVNLPAKLVNIVEGNISPREIALGVCFGAFLGFIPLNGPMALLLAIFFFLFRINRIATLLTLPVFKSVYLLGMYRLADAAGTYILEKVDYLAGFWRWITRLPIIAYLDVNNTLVTGGLIMATALSMPIYFIAKRLIIFLSAKYSDKIKNSALAKLVPGIKLMGLVGDDAGATLKNVKTHVALSIKARISEAIAKRRGSRRANSLLKRIKIINAIVVIVLLLAFHFGIGLFVSPAFSSFIVDSINKYSTARVMIDKVNIWPLTLSISLKGMKVFDPERRDLRIAKIEDSLVRISPVGLLSKRLVFSHIHTKGAEINLEGASDGSFNVGRLAAAKKDASRVGATDFGWSSLMQKKDLFGSTYEIIKKRFAKKDAEKIKEYRRNAEKVTKTIEVLPRGKLVHFKNAKDLYIFEIKDLDISDAHIKVRMDGNSADITNAKIRLGRMAYDPENGMKLDLLDIRGNISRDEKSSGKFDLFFSKTADSNGEKAVFNAELSNVDMDAVRFIYEGSLPIHVVKGIITLKSKTYIKAGAIDSRNEISLKDHMLEQKAGGSLLMGFMSISAVCDAMNRIDPLKLKFNITGTLDKPQFGGFQESLMVLIKPYIANFQEKIKKEGLKALERFMNKKKEEPLKSQ